MREKVVQIDAWRNNQEKNDTLKEVYVYSIGLDGVFRGLIDVRGDALKLLKSAEKNTLNEIRLKNSASDHLNYMNIEKITSDKKWLRLAVRFIASFGVVSQCEIKTLHILLFDKRMAEDKYELKVIYHPIQCSSQSPYTAFGKDARPVKVASC
jgi:hypothetical protein